MQIDYILFSKNNDASLSNESEVVDILRTCFDNIQDGLFETTYKHKKYNVEYVLTKHSMEQEKGFVFNISFSLSLAKKEQTAKVLESAHNIFVNCKETKKHHIVISRDEISAYYCTRAYPLFYEFESQLRNLVFNLLIKTFGALWLDKTINDELKNELKKKLRERNKNARDEKLIEQALYEMTVFQLEQFLFDEKRDVEPSQLIDIHLSAESVQSMSKEQILSILAKSRPKSLWEKCFASKTQITDLKGKITHIRNQRNKVAHCKPFYSDDYSESIKILKKDGLIQQIKDAADLGTEDLSTLSIRDVMVGLVDIGTKAAAFAGKAIEVAYPALIHLAKFGFAAQKALDVSGIGAALMQLANYQADLQPAFEMQQQITDIVNSPGVQAAMEAQEQFAAIANTPGMQAAMEAQEQFAAIANTSGVQAAMEAQEQFAAIANSPGVQAAMEAQEQFAAIANTPGMQAAMESQKHLQDLVGPKIPQSPLDKIGNSSLLRAFEYQDRLSRLVDPPFNSVLWSGDDDTSFDENNDLPDDITEDDIDE